MQVIGTSPEAVKISKTREFRQAKKHTESLFDPNDLRIDPTSNKLDDGLQRVYGNEAYRKEYREKNPTHIPDYQIDFFMNYYGRYSSDAKKLFKLAYSTRVKKWESFFDERMKNNR